MTGEIIKSFLVGLGFDVDDSSLARFNKSILSASLKITALYTGIQAATAGIFYGISKMAEGFENIGYELRLVAPAVNKMLLLRQAMLSAYRAAGIDLTKVVKESIAFNFSLAKTKFALEAVYKSVGAKFIPLLTKQMDIFRGKIFANMPKIQAALEKFVKFLFKAFEATIQLGTRVWSILGRVWGFFKDLDAATDGWSTKILLAIAAWKLLNLEFLATPLGMILVGLLAILALWDDFKTWQEGGQSLFDWSKFLPIIASVKAYLKDLGDYLGDLSRIIFGVVDAFIQLFHLDFTSFKFTVQNIFEDIKTAADHLIVGFKDLFKVGSAIGGWASSVFGSGGAKPAVDSISKPAPSLPPGNSNTQHVNQETNILVQGSADAGAVGKSVASEQNRVNFDMTRNMKGAMQ